MLQRLISFDILIDCNIALMPLASTFWLLRDVIITAMICNEVELLASNEWLPILSLMSV